MVDDKIKAAQSMEFVFEKGIKHCGRNKNAGYRHFLLFPECFNKFFSLELLKLGNEW